MAKPDRALERYYREVRSLLPCSRKQKDGILARFRASVNDYLADHPNAGITQVREHFGAPEDIAAAYVESEGTAEILAALRLRRRVMTVIAAVAVVVLISWGAVVTGAAMEARNVIHGDIIKTGAQILPTDTIITDGVTIIQNGD